MKFILPDKLEEFDKYTSIPFIIFEKKNFLNNDLYQALNKEFPKEDFFKKISKEGNKKSMDNSDNNFYDFLKTSNIWNNFYNAFNDKKIINYFFELIRNELIKIEQRSDIKKVKFIKNYRSNNYYNKIINKFYKIKYSTVRLGFQFSIIKKECFIPPHCDVSSKLLSLMLYFPPPSNNENYKKYGTNFYKLNENYESNFNIWDSKLTDSNFIKDFKKNYSIFYKSEFEPNKLVGFIKSDNSWHDVDLIKEDHLRRSININLYLI